MRATSYFSTNAIQEQTPASEIRLLPLSKSNVRFASLGQPWYNQTPMDEHTDHRVNQNHKRALSGETPRRECSFFCLQPLRP